MRPSLHDRGPRNHAMASASLSTARAAFGSPPPDARPMVRWWWFGPAQTEEMIQADLNAIASGGWGGVELAVVYPLSIDGEPAPYEYLSPTFLQRVGFAAERAHELGLRFDLTLGGGWSYGGPHIPRELAAKRLCWDVVEVAPQEATWPVAAARAGEHLVAAYWGEGTVEAPPTDWTRLDATPGTPLALPARPGSAVLALAWSVPTGQTVKRAPLGGEGYILDHYSPAAIARHLQVVGEPLLAAAQAGGERRVTAVFCDSLEVQGADWTEDAPGEFARRRGYDLLDVLPSLCERLGRQADQRVRHDLGRTLTELFEERFVRPLRDWAHEHGVLLRLQGYGSPPAAMGSASQVDLIEGESWGWDGVPPGRWAASAAQAVGEQVVSAETWTWIASPSMAATPLDLQAEAVEHLSLGVNHFIGHGWPSSPREIPDPGWLFYAAGALTDRNPWWPLAPDLTTWLARWSAIARLGVPVRDIGVYVPDCLAYGRLSPGSGAASMDLWRSTSGLVPAGLIGHLRAAGYDVAVVDDAALDTAHLRHRVLVAIGGDAAPILHCGVSEVIDASEGDVLARVSAAVGPAALPNVSHAAGVVRVHRALADADLHLLLNVSSHSARVQVPGEGGGWEVWDARDGAMHAVNAGSSLEVPAHGGVILADTRRPHRGAVSGARAWRDVPTRWVLASAAPAEFPVFADWRGSAEGVALAARVQVPDGVGHLRIDLGPGSHWGEGGAPTRESGPSYRCDYRPPAGTGVVVAIDGVQVGALWSEPYRLDVPVAPGLRVVTVTALGSGAGGVVRSEALLARQAELSRRYGPRFSFQDLAREVEIVVGFECAPSVALA